MVEMPECEKLKAVQEKSQAIGEFLEWLTTEKGYFIQESRTRIIPAEDSLSGKAYSVQNIGPIRESWERLLAEFFEIDLDKVEQEKRALLEEIRRGGP
jgi:hypothetical protein